MKTLRGEPMWTLMNYEFSDIEEILSMIDCERSWFWNRSCEHDLIAYKSWEEGNILGEMIYKPNGRRKLV